ncbi:hypothetical protein SAMN04490202_1787 [Pseudomonas reinekei]|uniref:Secreted protein n=1 Tax=Pseudomonas reinekei TaxID=395598 RepID=A0A1H0M881_PSERE|nr:hypothetical protein [Pseudomonas reinekei]KAB0484790.1 hypothetical protein F7R15_15855 [Pseudomonas reinekei]OLU01598.1 hypothetical protein BVK86_17760 [Pseudomonas reinekei]SDO76436.1 hypothetical protein SAMN04490202_1787 [Pseudomonas reinekei]
MNRLLRILLMMKVLVMLALGSPAVWAECEEHETQASSGQGANGELMLAKSEAEPGDKGQGGAEGDDASTTDEPDSDDADEGDSQT